MDNLLHLLTDFIEEEDDFLRIYVKEKGKPYKDAKYYYGRYSENINGIEKLKEGMKLKKEMLDLVINDFKGEEIEVSLLRDSKDIVWKNLGKV